MVMSWKKFLEDRKNIAKAKRQETLPWASDIEETTTPDTNPIQEPDETRQKKVWNTINTIWWKIINSKIWQSMLNFANKIPDSQLGQLVEKASSTPSAEEIKTETQEAIEWIKTTEEERDILVWEDAELKKKYRFLRWAATIAKETPIIKRLWISKDFVQKWEDFEKSTYLSNGAIVIKEPTLEQINNLDNTKSMAASVVYAYTTKWKIVDAQTVREKFEWFEDVTDDELNRFISWVLYSYIHRQDIDRDYVAEKYWNIVKSDDYLSKKQATINFFLNDNTWIYGMDETMDKIIEEDPELKKAIDAYRYIWVYAERLEENWYNMLGSTARWLAQSYKDEWLEIEWGMSLKDAYETAAKYDSNKIQNLINQLSYNLQKTEKYSTRKYESVEEYPGRRNAKKLIQDLWNWVTAMLSDFSEYNVEWWSESWIAKYSPLWLADLWISGNTFTDEWWNIRNRSWEMIYERHDDWTYTNKKWENVTNMLREHKWLLKNMGNHFKGITEWIWKTMEWAAMAETTSQKEWTRAWVEYELEVAAWLLNTAFNTTLLANPRFLMIESTPVLWKWVELSFWALAELWASITLWALQIANLENNMDPENVEAAKELWWTLTTIMGMNKFKAATDPYRKAFLEAKEKVFKAYKDRMVNIMGRDEMNNKIKKEALPDKTKEETIIDWEKTVWEIEIEKKTEKAVETKQEVVKQTPSEKIEVKEPMQKEVIDITPTKDKLWYVFQVNKAVISDMIKDFRTEYSKALDKYLPKYSSARALFSIWEQSTTMKEQAQRMMGDLKLTFSDMVKNASNWIKELRRRVTTRTIRKRQEDAYDKMKFSTDEKETMRNNSKRGKLGQILQNLISSKRGKIVKDKNVTWSQVAKMVKDSVAKDRVKEQLQRWRDRLQEWKKIIQKDFYQKLSSIKDINFWRFFTGENWIKKALKELFRWDTDAETYVRFREVDWKIIMEYKKWYSVYFDEYVAPELKKLVKEYNDMVENGKVSEQNISKINDSIKVLRKKWEGMIKSQDPLTRDQGKAILNAANNLNRALKEFLTEENVANKLLVWERASEAIHDMEEMFKNITKDWKIDENKARSFLENLSEEDIQTLESLWIETREYIDLIKNGSTALEKIFNFELSLKEYKSKVGDLLWRRWRLKSTARWKAGTLTAVVLGWAAAKILGALWLFAIFTSPIDKALWKLADKNYQRNLKKSLEKALRNPQNKKQLENILEWLNDTIEEIDAKINKVIEQRTKESTEQESPKTEKTETETEEGPNRKEYDTSHPNREEYDPNNPIFRNGEDKQQPAEQRDNDMVVSDQESLPWADKKELPDNRQYLGLVENPEQELDRAMNDLETQVKDALKQLTEMINDRNDDVPPTGPTGPDDTTPTTGPTGPDKGGNWGGEDPISEFIKIIEWDAPEQWEGRPDFKNRSNESLKKLVDKDWNFKEWVPEEFHQEILDELSRREIKKQIDDSEVRTQNNIIRAILKQLDQIAEWKAEDNIREKYNEQVMQAWNVDTNRADIIIWDIVNWVITESDVYQDKTTYEDNQEASSRIEKRTGKKTKATKSASKTSSLEVWDTKPDSQGKLNALKSQLEQKKKALPKVKSAKTLQKKQEEIDKLEKEITRIEEKLWAKPLDNFDVADKEAVDNMIAEEEKPQVQPSGEKISEPQEEQSSTMDDLMTFKAKDKSPEEIKNVQAELTKRKNENNLEWYSVEDVDKQIRTLNKARIGKQNEKSKKEDVQEVEDAIMEDIKQLSSMEFTSTYQWGKANYEEVNLEHVWEWEGVAAHWYWIYVAADPATTTRYTFGKRRYRWKKMSSEAQNILDRVLLRMENDRLTFKEAIEEEKKLAVEWGWISDSDPIKEVENISPNDIYPEWTPNWKYKWMDIYEMDSVEWDVVQRVFEVASEKAGEMDYILTREDIQEALDKFIENEYWEYSKQEINMAKKIDVNDFEMTTPTIYEILIPKQQKANTPTWELYLDEQTILTKGQLAKFDEELKKQWYNWTLLSADKRKIDWKLLYEIISTSAKSDKKASEILHRMWYAWIQYIGNQDWLCWVVFSPKATQMINKMNKESWINFKIK